MKLIPEEEVPVSTEDEVKPEEDVVQPVSSTEEEAPDKQELSQALDTVVEYITDKVAAKVSQNISGTTSEGQQNGFDALNTAAETMASSGGRKRKTRRFKLVNKNRTKSNK